MFGGVIVALAAAAADAEPLFYPADYSQHVTEVHWYNQDEKLYKAKEAEGVTTFLRYMDSTKSTCVIKQAAAWNWALASYSLCDASS